MAKTPRLDPYLRLISRFYEPIYLLYLLRSTTRGSRHVTSLDLSNIGDVRRRFLKNLAFLCDYMKGGPSTTAVAVQHRSDCKIFWVASNEGPSQVVVAFLKEVLETLKRYSTLPDPVSRRNEFEEALARKCTEFSKKRIKKQAKNLNASVKACMPYVSTQLADDQGLKTWLGRFYYSQHASGDMYSICQGAYQARGDTEMSIVERLCRDPDDGSAANDITMAFRKVRHTIGCLASHVRAAKQLLDDVCRLGNLLDRFEVSTVSVPPAISLPEADGHTNLRGALRRMTKADDPRFEDLWQYLQDLDRSTSLEEGLQAHYTARRSPLCVHAEVQMLHHFHDGGFLFLDNDRYIAISKLACICCKIYFRHHPARVVEPDCHEKIYPNWGPILLPLGAKDPGMREQLRLLTSVNQHVREGLLDDLERRRLFSLTHPDSETNITHQTRLDLGESSDSADEHWIAGDEFSDSDDSQGGIHI